MSSTPKLGPNALKQQIASSGSRQGYERLSVKLNRIAVGSLTYVISFGELHCADVNPHIEAPLVVVSREIVGPIPSHLLWKSSAS